jgi:hypothetical protein
MALALVKYEDLFKIVRGYPCGVNGEKQTGSLRGCIAQTD